MKRLFLICLALMTPQAAIAHTSVAPHEHPHDVSILPDVTVMLLAAFVVACAFFAFRHFRRG